MKGKGIKEKGYDEQGNTIIECDKPSKTFDAILLGDAKARLKLKWKPIESVNSLINEMVEEEYFNLDANKKDKIFV